MVMTVGRRKQAHKPDHAKGHAAPKGARGNRTGRGKSSQQAHAQPHGQSHPQQRQARAQPHDPHPQQQAQEARPQQHGQPARRAAIPKAPAGVGHTAPRGEQVRDDPRAQARAPATARADRVAARLCACLDPRSTPAPAPPVERQPLRVTDRARIVHIDQRPAAFRPWMPAGGLPSAGNGCLPPGQARPVGRATRLLR